MFGVIKRNPCLPLAELRKLIAGKRSIEWDSEGSAYSYSGYSRFALRNILSLLAFPRGSRILLPAYICDVVLLPFAELGLEPAFYRITDDFQVDLSSLVVAPNTSAILTVNYFGMSIDFPAVDAFAQKHGLVWINDNAHGYASVHGTMPLDEFGDFSITSFRKVLPTINGARARINRPSYKHLIPHLDLLNNSGPREHAMARFLLVTLLGAMKYRPWKHPDYTDITAFSEPDIMPQHLDRLSAHVLMTTDDRLVRERRHALYGQVEKFLGTGKYPFIKVIDGLMNNGNSPMLFPIIVPDQERWRSILETSRSQGIDIHTWPSMPRDVIRDNIFGSVDRWKTLLCLPIHQDLDGDEYCASLKKVFDASDK